jgi:hypothetical protein
MNTINLNIDINSISIAEKIKLFKFLYELINAKITDYENSN